MISDELGHELHRKAVTGDSLTAEEKNQLEQWYRELDQREELIVSVKASESQIATFHAQVDQALSELSSAARKLQETSAANEALRSENAALHDQLARRE